MAYKYVKIDFTPSQYFVTCHDYGSGDYDPSDALVVEGQTIDSPNDHFWPGSLITNSVVFWNQLNYVAGEGCGYLYDGTQIAGYTLMKVTAIVAEVTRERPEEELRAYVASQGWTPEYDADGRLLWTPIYGDYEAVSLTGAYPAIERGISDYVWMQIASETDCDSLLAEMSALAAGIDGYEVEYRQLSDRARRLDSALLSLEGQHEANVGVLVASASLIGFESVNFAYSSLLKGWQSLYALASVAALKDTVGVERDTGRDARDAYLEAAKNAAVDLGKSSPMAGFETLGKGLGSISKLLGLNDLRTTLQDQGTQFVAAREALVRGAAQHQEKLETRERVAERLENIRSEWVTDYRDFEHLRAEYIADCADDSPEADRAPRRDGPLDAVPLALDRAFKSLDRFDRLPQLDEVVEMRGRTRNDLDTGRGRDMLNGNGAVNTVHLGAAADVALGRGGDDRFFGGLGSDLLYGNAGNDVLIGQRGHDGLIGGAGADRLLGGTGQDLFVGGGGADRLFGGPRDDVLYGQSGRDRLAGGSGGDEILWRAPS